MKKTLPFLFAFLCAALPTYAHPGHGEQASGFSLTHYLANPEHALPLMALLALLSWAVYRLRQTKRSQP
ncbi:MAG: hypothetical protein ACFCUI_06090 [Bernardetiaceae bacterium]